MSELGEIVKVDIKIPYKILIKRVSEHEAEMFSSESEEKFRGFLQMLVNKGHKKTFEDLWEETKDCYYLTDGVTLDWELE